VNRRLKRVGLAAIDAAVRPLLAPFRRPRPPASAPLPRDEDAVAFARAAEDYYRRHVDAAHLTNKPFSEPETFARRLTDLGVLADGLRLRPGDVVLELGAGAGWLSHFLNRFGCRTIAVDIAPTALDMARTRFERDPHTNWALDPAFLAYDGRTLPVDAASVDAVVCYDTYHHLPNPAGVLRELRRVLRDDGVVGMSEPGRGHARSAQSALEAGTTGVLERELVLEEIAADARGAGFAAARVIVAPRAPLLEVDADRLRDFMGGFQFSTYWHRLCAALDGHHYLLLHAGDPQPSTRRPRRLMAEISTPDAGQLDAVGRGVRKTLTLTARNLGDTRWLHAPDQPGWTRLGAHLYRTGAALELVDFDWVRAGLPRDVPAGSEVTVTMTLPGVSTPGRYLILVDLVVEGLTWFAERESQPLALEMVVR
jgi:SAM-dependent methyltransferase